MLAVKTTVAKPMPFLVFARHLDELGFGGCTNFNHIVGIDIIQVGQDGSYRVEVSRVDGNIGAAWRGHSKDGAPKYVSQLLKGVSNKVKYRYLDCIKERDLMGVVNVAGGKDYGKIIQDLTDFENLKTRHNYDTTQTNANGLYAITTVIKNDTGEEMARRVVVEESEDSEGYLTIYTTETINGVEKRYRTVETATGFERNEVS